MSYYFKTYKKVHYSKAKLCQILEKEICWYVFTLMIFRERYRDLILAADTIGKMKITSEKVTTRIANIEDNFRELQKKYLIGFKTEPVEDKLDK